MNQFGHIADELTSIEMSVDDMLECPHAKALKAALQRAFVAASLASRAYRRNAVTAQTAGSGAKVRHDVRFKTAREFADAK